MSCGMHCGVVMQVYNIIIVTLPMPTINILNNSNGHQLTAH